MTPTPPRLHTYVLLQLAPLLPSAVAYQYYRQLVVYISQYYSTAGRAWYIATLPLHYARINNQEHVATQLHPTHVLF